LTPASLVELIEYPSQAVIIKMFRFLRSTALDEVLQLLAEAKK